MNSMSLRGGYESELKKVRDYFKKNDEATIKEIYVGRSRSTVEFIEYPGVKFNSVLFSDFEDRLPILFE